MKNKYLNKIMVMFLTLGILNSCDSFLDVNTDPNNPIVGQPSLLLTNAQINIVGSIGMGSGVNRELNVFMHQMVRRGEGDQYATFGSDFAIGSPWGQFYDAALQDLEIIIVEETVNDNMIYVGMAKLLKAYSYSTIVDLWGDVPFTEATRAAEIRFPVYDDDEAIYVSVLALIDEAIGDLNNTGATNTLVPAGDDLFYGGTTANWIKFANTLKLRMLMNMSDVSTVADRDAQIVQLISDNNLISSSADNLQVTFGASATPENRHPLFVSEYTQANPGFYVSPWLYETMQGQNPNILTGVVDPRIPYYWHRQLLPGEAAENPVEYQQADGFLSIHFGSIHPNQASGQQSSQSVFGLYACGGFYDDGSGTKAAATTGNGVAPERLFPYFNRLYMEAELALSGVITGDARALLQSAIEESFAEVNAVVGTNGQTGVPTISTANRDAYVASALAEYDAGDDATKLQVMMTQKWLSNLGNSVDTYNDYRRNGALVLFDPNNYNGNDPATYGATTQAGNGFPVSLPWEETDLDLNPNAPSQKSPSEDRVFWDAN